MAEVILEKRWRNSRGELDGWSFTVDGQTVHWSYDALFDASTDERSRGSADFDLQQFEEFLHVFERDGAAKVSGSGGAWAEMKRITAARIAITIRPSFGDGCSSDIDASKRGVVAPLGVDLATRS